MKLPRRSLFALPVVVPFIAVVAKPAPTMAGVEGLESIGVASRYFTYIETTTEIPTPLDGLIEILTTLRRQIQAARGRPSGPFVGNDPPDPTGSHHATVWEA